ncbi:hypothetical protein BDA99DRAFT_547890 [Phascolomyces articulosus]|uniref:NADH:flavin oxidoreductase/NADH oxidase N-terminal domain-containing protein n=1 Tax=Phascolomyces articulosus TaxID=60185 RepID=A0AAD5JVM8_9FUNG|nr:hypothetical protein BDA99DRAFT_547890 [Phascolomyces articulosus]
MSSTSALFRPIKLGAKQLKHRIVMAPMTRLRADKNHVPTDLIREHYEQRATDGGLLITEGTLISPYAGGMANAPGLWTEEQVNGWKLVVDAVHKKNGIIYNQLWHLGRASSSFLMPDNVKPVSASAIAIQGKNMAGQDYEVPRALELDEIPQLIQDYANAAKNAIKAGFDGVELHGATGYIIDQFVNSNSNVRTDKYGGSIENRARFPLELIDAVAEAIGSEKTAIRFSPLNHFQDMNDETPYETWGYILDQLKSKHPNLAYVHFVEPRVGLMNEDNALDSALDTKESLDPFRAKWDGVFISGGGYTYSPELAAKVSDSTGNLISFGRTFTSNPDLVERLRNGHPLAKYDRPTLYGGDRKGYNDFPNYSA